MKFKVDDYKLGRHPDLNLYAATVAMTQADGHKLEYKFYKDRPVNEIQNQDTSIEDSLLEEATEIPEDRADDIETVAEPGYNFIELEVV